MAVKSELYRANGRVSYARMDNEYVIYHHDSGNTHLFHNIPKVLIEHCFSGAGFNRDDLYKVLQQFPEFKGYDFYRYIGQLLVVFENKELIELIN